VTATLAAAFLHADLGPWLVPDPAERREVYAGYFRIFAEFFVRHGQVDVTGDLGAVALWWPVGNQLEMDIPDYGERLSKVTGTAVGRFLTLDMAMHAHHPQRRPHHYLAFLAVHPERQGQGRGSALLRHRLERLDRQGVPAYLEATSIPARAMYERFGFRLTYPIDIPAGPTLYPLWRVSAPPAAG
jgi:GNAT superfamily N-acetyltransferase